MNQYANSYFNIKIEFPDTWDFRYQMADDDLPTQSAPEKELLVKITELCSGNVTLTLINY